MRDIAAGVHDAVADALLLEVLGLLDEMVPAGSPHRTTADLALRTDVVRRKGRSFADEYRTFVRQTVARKIRHAEAGDRVLHVHNGPNGASLLVLRPLTHPEREQALEFVGDAEPRIRRALTAAFGLQAGRDATTDALAVAWRHWERVSVMDNPIGYLYRVGFNQARRPETETLRADLTEATSRVPWVEPGLVPALVALPERQRVIVALVHGFEWSLAEVADLLDVSKSTVRTHEQRAMRTLRRKLGATV